MSSELAATLSEVAKSEPRRQHPDTRGTRSKKPYYATDSEQQIDAIRRDEASNIAADMEMGYYLTKEGEQWSARTFVIREILRAMGYSERLARNINRLRWWPGQEGFRKMVAWKIAIRRMQSQLDLSRKNAWAGPLIGFSVEEMGWRLSHHPHEVSDRDLTDLVTKLTRIFADGATSSGGAEVPPEKDLAAGAVRFTRITESIELMPDGPAKDKARRDYIELTEQARAALPAPS